MTPQRIREIRTALDLTQTEFAAKFGVQLNAVQKWEAGDREPSGPALVILAQLEEQAKPIVAKGKTKRKGTK